MNNTLLTNTTINLVAKSKKSISIHPAKTNNKGEFKIDNIYHFDSTQIAFNGFNSKRTPIDINISLKKQLKSVYTLNTVFHQSKNKYTIQNQGKIIVPKKNLTNLQGLNLTDRTLLNEVKIKGKAKRKKATRSTYNLEPDVTIFIKDSDLNFVHVLNRSAGVRVIGGGRNPIVSIRGYGSPLWVVDGVPINAFQPPPARDAAPSPTMAGAGPIPNEIASLNTEDIERMEILKGGKAAIFGGRGNNGVILIYTKIGGNNYKKIISPEFTINGITNKREFYIPKYNVKKSSSHFYPTLYWNPNIQTDKNGNATFTFINHSNTNQVQIAIDALTNYGIPGSYLKTITNK